ncbi:MAG: TonB-dependent receptor [Saprospiraceae bacterium]
MQSVNTRCFCLIFSFVTLWWSSGISVLHAQIDSVQVLKQIEVTAERIDLADIGKHTDRIDKSTLSFNRHEDLASALSMQTPLFVRSYGSGTLATLGIRGGSASHTQIVWNGIPLRNPMLGLQDLSLIPVVFFDEAAIHYGGHGSAFGSGAVGGLISISNSQVSKINRIGINLSAGSWGHRGGDIQLDYGIGRIRFSSRLFSQYAENNFRFRLDKGLPEHNQVHNQIKDNGILQEISYSIDEKQFITGRLWFQYADRQIPPLSTQNTSKAAQQDKILRASLQWNYVADKFHWQLKSAWLDEVNDYQDTLILLYTHNRFRTWLAEAEASYNPGNNVSIALGVNTEIAQGQSENYLTTNSRNQSAVFSSVRLVSNSWMWRLQARQELTEDILSPLLVDLSTEWTGIKKVTFKTSLSRNYRMPTLNDLNWRPGGNPDLVPEEGWTIEAGIHYKSGGEKLNIASSLTAYKRNIDQWIMWMPPVKGISDYWSPINIAKVNSRGLETRCSAEYIGNEWIADVNFGLDLTWSTFENALTQFQIEKGEQLFYVPVENLMTGLTLHFHHWTGYYTHHWFGSSSGINDLIKAANIGSAGLSVEFKGHRFGESLFIQADNIWNVPYRIIERRPMPGRSITAGVRFSIF